MKSKPLAQQLSELRTKPNRYGAEDVEAMDNRCGVMSRSLPAVLPFGNTGDGCY